MRGASAALGARGRRHMLVAVAVRRAVLGGAALSAAPVAMRGGTVRRMLCAMPGATPGARAGVLIDYIKKGDEDLARELVGGGEPIDLELADAYGSTALTLASRGGHLALTREILALNLPPAVLNAQNIFGSTALMCAAASGHAGVAAELLKQPDVSVNIFTRYGSSALSKAAEAGHSEIVAQLLARGARVAPNVLGKTPAELAGANGHADVASMLQPITPQRDPISVPLPKPDLASQPPVRARVCGLRAGNIVCQLDTAVQGPPATVIAARGEGVPAMLPVNEFVLLRRDPDVKPSGWVIVEVCKPETGVKKAKQRCLHPRRPWDKKCVDCPDKRLAHKS
ncbi:ankyrin repeat-containing domain protein [Pavlovales sp. CCMP2436]|nr:ankyrin repeat-containing domain protein [Pavlovales sp. CCMP2436]